MKTLKNKLSLMAIIIAIFTLTNQMCIGQSPSAYPSGLGFVKNIGQLFGTDTVQHPERYYYGNAGNSNLFLSDSVFSYVYASVDTDTLISDSLHTYYILDTLYRFDMKLNRINNNYNLTATDTSQGYSNFYYGDSAWTHALTYQEIKYENIYDDIDFAFYSEDEFRFYIDSNGDDGSIEFYYQGVDSVLIDAQGGLNVYTRFGNKKYIAKAYEFRSSQWYEFDVDFSKSDSIISFSLGAHTSGVPLILKVMAPVNGYLLSPVPNNLKWSTFYGSSITNVGAELKEAFYDVYIDNDNYVYAIASTIGTDFPIDLFTNPIQQNNASQTHIVPDVFIIKFRPDRSRAITTYYGGSSRDIGTSITTDASGNIIFTGFTFSGGGILFPQCCGGYNQSYNNGGSNPFVGDAFIAKLTSNGMTPLMSTFYGGEGVDMAMSIAVDNNDNIIIAGGSSDDVPVPGTQPSNAFVQSYHDNTNTNLWETSEDGFIAKFNTSNDLVWATCLGGNNGASQTYEFIYSISSDAAGNLYALGMTQSQDIACAPPCSTNSNGQYFPICNPGITGSEYVVGKSGGYDNFICQFNTSYQIEWSTMFGGDENEPSDNSWNFPWNYSPRAIGIAPFDNSIYITGSTLSDQSGTAFPMLDPNINNCKCYDNTLDGTDAYIARFNSNFELAWGTYYGGNGLDASYGLAFYYDRSVWIAGMTSSSNSTLSFAMDQGSNGAFYDNTLSGGQDGFVLRFNDEPFRLYAAYFGGDNYDAVKSISSDYLHENVIIVGHTDGTLNSSDNFPLVNFDLYSTDDWMQSAHLSTAQHPFISNFDIDGDPDRMQQSKTNLPDKLDKQINIYPNPALQKVSVSSSDNYINRIRIKNIIGETIYYYENLFVKLNSINLSSIPNGLYIIETEIADVIYRNKMIISR